MKKLLLSVSLLFSLSLACPANAQQFVQSISYTGTTVPGGQATMLQNSNVSNHQLVWTVTGTVSSCTVVLQTSSDAASWSTMSGTASQTCTSSGSYTFTGGAATYVRFNVTAFSATGSVQFNYYGYTNVPSFMVSDGVYHVPPGACGFGSSGGTITPATANGVISIGASFLNVNQIATTTGTETATLSCDITPPSRLTAGKGVTIAGLLLEYGNSTGVTGTCNAPTINAITLPVAGASETPSAVTPGSTTAGGTLTVTPVVGSCNTAAVTAGQLYSEGVSFGTPAVFNSSATAPIKLFFQQGFVGPASASYTLYTAGVDVYYNNVVY
jgi:hypothetical protein